MLQTLDEVERSIGGRPRQAQQKVRLSVYLLPAEAQDIRERAERQGLSTSMLLRLLVLEHVNRNTQ